MAAVGVGNADFREAEPGGGRSYLRGTHEVDAHEDAVRVHPLESESIPSQSWEASPSQGEQFNSGRDREDIKSYLEKTENDGWLQGLTVMDPLEGSIAGSKVNPISHGSGMERPTGSATNEMENENPPSSDADDMGIIREKYIMHQADSSLGATTSRNGAVSTKTPGYIFLKRELNRESTQDDQEEGEPQEHPPVLSKTPHAKRRLSPSAAASVTPGAAKTPRATQRGRSEPDIGANLEATDEGQDKNDPASNSFVSQVVKSHLLRDIPCPKCQKVGSLRKNGNGPGGRKVICRGDGGCGGSTTGTALRETVGTLRSNLLDRLNNVEEALRTRTTQSGDELQQDENVTTWNQMPEPRTSTPLSAKTTE